MAPRMLRPVALAVTAALVALAASGSLGAKFAGDRFDHLKHRALFPSCTSCHTGIASAEQPGDTGVWPPAATCLTCHDGTVESRVDWEPPPAPRTNLRFTHPDAGDDELPASKPAEWRRPSPPLRVPVWLAGLAVLFSLVLLCGYRGELAEDAARLGERLGGSAR